jgi:GxxExxY protein
MNEELTYKINGCLFAVYNELKNIWMEEVYEKALHLELLAQGLKAERQKEFEVWYFEKQVGIYRLDLLVEDFVIVELKAVPQTFPLHQAQLISYLKGFQKPIGILANFGAESLEHWTFPNKLVQKQAMQDNFDVDKIQLESKDEIRDLLVMANRILVTLGPGYFHQIYRRAFYYELQQANVPFEVAKEVKAIYRQQELDSKEVRFFLIGDLLLSAVAVQSIDDLLLSKFQHYIEYYRLTRGLLVNFNALHLDFKYMKL